MMSVVATHNVTLTPTATWFALRALCRRVSSSITPVEWAISWSREARRVGSAFPVADDRSVVSDGVATDSVCAVTSPTPGS